MAKLKRVSVKILNKEYEVSCPPDKEDSLQEAAFYLDQKMFEIRKQGRVLNLERIAIMAALNIAHELLSNRQQKEIYVQSISEQIEQLQNRIDDVLIPFEKDYY